MDIRKIKKLIELLEESGIAEIEIKEGEESVRIIRQGHNPVAAGAPAAASPTAPAPAFRPAGAAEPSTSEPAAPPRKVLKSPMVGTFYRAASPGAKPLVDVGQNVSIGDPIGIIEAMKMFNQVEADQNGVIAEVLVEDGQPVEYDQPLFALK
ncbi:MAG: acetyl-CoA carboxylase biotin carboxyl carrier protein [Candidatus Competibacteraceae bacterium]|nr:acetyl-CoA carboxylase biotin carboxyl carrier protein [Candidatus Competibacteraceae bacterium]MCB1814986.1 acetyl-CoA carboxylase biotin carboxyl carrier protein [Candidatus Competibacteraceae bacterium]